MTAWLLLALILLAGCASEGGGRLSIRSVTDPAALLRGGFERGVYQLDESGRVTVLLYDGPDQAPPEQVVVLRTFWQPQIGRTPISRTSTNTTIHYVIFTGTDRSRVGIYSGAGFVYPDDRPGGQVLRGALWDSNLQLSDASEGFVDLLGHARMEGRFTAIRDDVGVDRRLRDLNVMLRERLGRPRMVLARPASHLHAR